LGTPAFAAMQHMSRIRLQPICVATLVWGLKDTPGGIGILFLLHALYTAVVTQTAESFSDSPVTRFIAGSYADAFRQDYAPQSEYDGVFYTSFYRGL
jgi:hypothetical protein